MNHEEFPTFNPRVTEQMIEYGVSQEEAEAMLRG